MLDENSWRDAPVSTGTTIMAMEFADGVVLAADSRTSSGVYVANRVTDKLTRLTDKIYCCRSGSAADTQAVADIVAYSMNYHQNQLGEEPLVLEAASEFRNYCYNYRSSLTAGIIVAGWDKRKGGQVYSIPLGGMLKREPITTGGSGSSYINAFVREFYRPGMKRDECVAFAMKAIKHAIYNDGSSGGVIRVGVITCDGIERFIFYNTEDGEPVAVETIVKSD